MVNLSTSGLFATAATSTERHNSQRLLDVISGRTSETVNVALDSSTLDFGNALETLDSSINVASLAAEVPLELDADGVSDSPLTNCSNSYCVSDEEYVDMIRDFIRPDALEWCLIALDIVVFIVGVFGNLLVVYVVWYDRRMRTVTNLFIVNLSIADFLVVVVCMPPTVLGDVTETWYMGNVMCKVVQYLQGVSVSVSVMTLSAISVERFYAICHPLKFKATLRRARTTICVIWITAAIILLPEVIVLQTVRTLPERLQTDLLTTCQPVLWDDCYQIAYQLFLIVALYAVPLVLMGAAYTKIAVCLWSTVIPSESVHTSGSVNCNNSTTEVHMSTRYAAETTSAGDTRYHKVNDARSQTMSRRNVAQMLIAVVAMFAVCYLPVHLVNILRYANVNIPAEFALVAHWLCYFNSAINPVIYNFMSEKFQTAFRTVLRCQPCNSRRRRGHDDNVAVYSCRTTTGASTPGGGYWSGRLQEHITPTRRSTNAAAACTSAAITTATATCSDEATTSLPPWRLTQQQQQQQQDCIANSAQTYDL